MEFTLEFKDTENSSPLNSPHTNRTTATAATYNIEGGGGVGVHIARSDSNSPYPTTFVTADSASFKKVVQMLTGSSDNNHRDNHHQPPPKNSLIPPHKNKQGFKLYERRNYNALSKSVSMNMITPTYKTASFSPRHKPEILSPSLLDFPSLILSPVTPLTDDPFDKSSPSIAGGSSSEEEAKVIAEKGFYLRPSPSTTLRDSEPQLLSLFPLSSPRVSDP